MHGPTRVDFGSSTNLAYCTECTWRAESPTRERVRQAARQHAAIEHRDKRARWAYDQANHRARASADGAA
jgi:hypothetical protein